LDTDVILGTGSAAHNLTRHANLVYKGLLKDFAPSYQSAPNGDKIKIATRLVDMAMDTKNLRFIHAKKDRKTGSLKVTKVLTKNEVVTRTKEQLKKFKLGSDSNRPPIDPTRADTAQIVNRPPVAMAATSNADPLGYFQQFVRQGNGNLTMSGVHNEHVDRYVGVDNSRHTHTHVHQTDSKAIVDAISDLGSDLNAKLGDLGGNINSSFGQLRDTVVASATPGPHRNHPGGTDLLQSFVNEVGSPSIQREVGSPSIQRPTFDLPVALNDSMKSFVQKCIDLEYVDDEQRLQMTKLLRSYCGGIVVSESCLEGKNKIPLDISDTNKKYQKANVEGALVLDIKVGDRQANPADINIRSIYYNSVQDENPDETLFLPTVLVVDSNNSIVDYVPRFFESKDRSKTLAYSLLVATDSEGSIKFIVHCSDGDWLEEVGSPFCDDDYEAQNGSDALKSAAMMLDAALGCPVQHEIIVTLAGDVEVSLYVATPTSNDAKDPLSQITEAVATMGGVTAIQFVSSGDHLKRRPIFFDTDALDRVLGSQLEIGFKNVCFFNPSWQEASGELVFEGCRFNEDVLCEFGAYRDQTPPFQVFFKQVDDDCMPQPVKFLESIIKGVKRNRIKKVKFAQWDSDKNSTPIVEKLAELDLLLKDQLVLEGLHFTGEPYPKQTKNVKKEIEDLNKSE